MLSSATDPPYSRHRHRASRDRVNAQRGDELVVYEVGGGTGTNALNILNWLKREEPELYERTEYTIVEISKRLAERQHERVGTCHKVRQHKFLTVCMDNPVSIRICSC